MLPKKIILFVLLSAFVTLAAHTATSGNSHNANPAVPAPPKTNVEPVKETINGVEITDPYRWLEDQNSPETRAWINAQNAYTDSLLSKVPGRDVTEKEIAALSKIDAMGAPRVENDRYFFSKRSADQDQASLYMRKGLQGKDELLIDPLPMSPNHTVTVNLNDVSIDGSMLAYSIRQGGADEVTPHLFDVDAHKDLPDSFPKGRYAGISLTGDKSAVYYSLVTKEGPRVFVHKVGTNSANDTEIFGKGYGPEKIISVGVSEDDHYLQITVSHGSADVTELYFQDLKNKGPIVTLVKDLPSGFFGQIAGDKMYVRTN
ncbi:MAG TPA: S9 family peptidase, partial [Candidatus Angelobacter sp.]|nr:S9 family peptidase [Candidatus Angelobacter sp.]